MIKLTDIEIERVLDLCPDVPLSWAIGEHLGLTGTSSACGLFRCGTRSVPLNVAPAPARSTRLVAAAGGSSMPIEGPESAPGPGPILGLDPEALRAKGLEDSQGIAWGEKPDVGTFQRNAGVRIGTAALVPVVVEGPEMGRGTDRGIDEPATPVIAPAVPNAPAAVPGQPLCGLPLRIS